jgi:circadian clock protein KaiB
MTHRPTETAASLGGSPLLRLYIAGQSPRSLDAFANLRAICDQHLPGQYEIEIIDLVENPELAAADDVLALPTLVRLNPPPTRRIIGNLSDTDRVLGYLKLPTRGTW